MAAARRRTILALDCDCFYAQCEVRRDASLEGKPVGVRQKMLVITSNYAARAHGIKKGDSLAEVKRKCPDIVIKDGEDISHYTEVSNAWRAYVDKYRRPSGYSSDESRRRRGRDVDIPRSRRRRDLAIPWRRVATPPRPRFRGDESRRRRGRDVRAPTSRERFELSAVESRAARPLRHVEFFKRADGPRVLGAEVHDARHAQPLQPRRMPQKRARRRAHQHGIVDGGPQARARRQQVESRVPEACAGLRGLSASRPRRRRRLVSTR